jgi:hypothetical protein
MAAPAVHDLGLLAGPGVLHPQCAGGAGLDRRGDQLASLHLHVGLVTALEVDAAADVPVGRPGGCEADDAVEVLRERLVDGGGGPGLLLEVGLVPDRAADVSETVGVHLVRFGDRDQVAAHLRGVL